MSKPKQVKPVRGVYLRGGRWRSSGTGSRTGGTKSSRKASGGRLPK
jgi:hypothetical protein